MYDIFVVITSISTEDRQQNLDMLSFFFFFLFWSFYLAAGK